MGKLGTTFRCLGRCKEHLLQASKVLEVLPKWDKRHQGDAEHQKSDLMDKITQLEKEKDLMSLC